MSAILALPIFLLVILAVVALAIHFLPTVVAANRHAVHFWWIFLINFFFGFTLIGWIIALIWAFNDDRRYVPTYLPPPPRNL